MGKHLSDFRALLFDIDKTLTDRNREITPRTQTALRQLSERGYRIAVCSGRSYPALTEYIFKFFPPEAIHILSGGAQITRTNGEVIWQKNIPAEIVHPLVQSLQEKSAKYIYVAQTDALYVTDAYWEVLKDHPWQIKLKRLSELQQWDSPLVNVLEVSPEMLSSIKVYDSELTIKEMYDRSERMYLDMTAVGVNKGVALQEWCRLTEIAPHEILGFGDGNNDVEFLQTVGFAVAMGNGTEAVKDIANRVIGSIDDDGLGVYLENIGEGAEL